MQDLTQTKVAYSRSGYYTFEGSVCEVSAVLRGDGVAVLRLGDRDPIETKITPERYRALLQTMADNRFSAIEVKRRWGMYLADFGNLQIVLECGGRQRAVYADGKHYVDSPDQLQAIIDMICSFEKEFGCEFGYGPVAVTGVRDYREVALAVAAGAVVVLLSGVAIRFWYVRKRRIRAELSVERERATTSVLEA